MIGRFISADSFATTDANGFLSCNMFAYCENDPVNRSDPTGEWAHLIIGAVIGAASQYICDVAANRESGLSWAEALRPTSTIADYAGAALSGALSASGVGLLGSVVGNALISSTTYLANQDIKGEKVGLKEWGEATATGALSGLIGGRGADGKRLMGVVKRSKTVLKTAVSPKKTSMYTAKIYSAYKNAAVASVRTSLSIGASNWKRFVR